LENLPSGHEVIQEIREQVADDVLILVDGGVRSGEDVFKALALGADLVLIGRPVLIFGAGASEEGVSYYLDSIGQQLRRTMLLAGVKTVSDVQFHMIKRIPD